MIFQSLIIHSQEATTRIQDVEVQWIVKFSKKTFNNDEEWRDINGAISILKRTHKDNQDSKSIFSLMDQRDVMRKDLIIETSQLENSGLSKLFGST